MLDYTFVAAWPMRGWGQGERKEISVCCCYSSKNQKQQGVKGPLLRCLRMTSPWWVVVQTEACGNVNYVSLLNSVWCWHPSLILSRLAQNPEFFYELCEKPLKAFSDDTVSSAKNIWPLIKYCMRGEISGMLLNGQEKHVSLLKCALDDIE